MAVSAVTTTTAAQNATETQQSNASKQATLDYTAFLNLLIAQMKNQDPTAPADPAEWMGQIASFSNVEQAIQTNAKLDAMMTSMSLSQVDGIIGHTVTSLETGASGKVTAIQIISGGAVAILENGDAVLLGEGVVITE
jgi:flagellar basal-body rod modification protein FlgD